MAAQNFVTDSSHESRHPACELPLREIKIHVVGLGGWFARCVVDWQTGLAEGPKWDHCFDPTQPVSEDQALWINNKPYLNKYYHQEIFLSHFRITNPDWAKFDKPHLKRALTETEACILVYNCTDRECFNLLVEGWDQVQSEQDISDAVARGRLWVVHDNIDVDSSMWEVTVEEGQAWAQKIGARFRALSSRTGKGTEGLGLEIARQVLESDKAPVAEDKPAQALEQPSTKAKNLRARLRSWSLTRMKRIA